MNVLVITPHYYPENFTITKIAEQLVTLGHTVTVLTGKPNYGFGHILEEYKGIKEETINNVRVCRINHAERTNGKLSLIKNYLSFWRNSKRWVRKTKEKFDVVYTMSLSPVIVLSAGNLYKKKHNVPHIVHCVDLWPESVLATKSVRKKSLIYKILYKWSKKLYSKADKILIGSPSYEEYFKNVLKLDKKLVYIPQPSIIEDIDSIESIKLKEGFNLVYSGNLGILQELEKVPEIMSHVKNRDVYFHIIGTGPKEEKLVKNIMEFKQENNVFFYGPMKAEDASKYVKSADAVYLCLNDEGYVGKTIPGKLIMYLSFGKAILGAVYGDSQKIITANDGGIVCSNNIIDIANKIDEMSILSKKELTKMGNKNKTLYDSEFSIEKVVNKINEELTKNI